MSNPFTSSGALALGSEVSRGRFLEGRAIEGMVRRHQLLQPCVLLRKLLEALRLVVAVFLLLE
jgi:hypothetical protein